MLAGQLSAQNPDSVRSMYGVPDDEFVRGAWIDPRNHARWTDPATGVTTELPADATPYMSLWQFADSLGITTLRYKDYAGPDSLENLLAQRTRSDQRIIVSHRQMWLPNLGIPETFGWFNTGFSQQAVFYPFDSARCDAWQNRFLNLPGPVSVSTNPGVEKNEFGDPAGERTVSTDESNVAGQLIASGIAYAYAPWQTFRYARQGTLVAPHDSVVQNVDWPFRNVRSSHQWNRRWYVNVRGHLFPIGTPAGPDDAVLRIELWHEVPAGQSYWDPQQSSGVTVADTFSYQLGGSIMVRRRDLAPADPENLDRNAYVDTSYAFDLPDFFFTDPGASRRIDIRVYWTGAEPVALRSIALRDHVAELLMGKSLMSRPAPDRIFLSSSGKTARTRAFDAFDVDRSLKMRSAYILELGHLNDSSRRYTMVGRGSDMMAAFSGGPTGPDSAYDAWFATSGWNAYHVPLGDVNGDGWDDVLFSDPGYPSPTFRQGLAIILSGGAYIPRDSLAPSAIRDVELGAHRDAFTLWPMPIIDHLNVAWRGDLPHAPRRYRIVDARGFTVAEGPIGFGGSTIRWNASGAPAGAYVVTLLDGAGSLLMSQSVVVVR
jgi:hypothetical protein